MSRAPLTPEHAAVAGIIQGDATILRPTGRIAPHLRLLPISGTIRYVQYEWDNGKAATNLRKHGVDFPDAIAALEDPNRIEEVDTRFVYDEERVQVIGVARGKYCS